MKVARKIVRLSRIWGTVRASKLFAKAQRIFRKSFPPEERDHGNSMRAWLREEHAGDNSPSRYEYSVSTKGDVVVGMSVYDIVTNEDAPAGSDAVVFWSYIATKKAERNTGVARELVKDMVADAVVHCREVDRRPSAVFLEVEKPELDELVAIRARLNAGERVPVAEYDKLMRNVIRPNFHHRIAKAGAMVVKDEDGKPRLVYYAQPGLERVGEQQRWANRVEMLPVVSLIERGDQVPFEVEPNSVVNENGQFVGDWDSLPRMSVGRAETVVKTIMDVYADDYDNETQTSSIMVSVRRSLRRSSDGNVYLVPIHDTVGLEFEK